MTEEVPLNRPGESSEEKIFIKYKSTLDRLAIIKSYIRIK